MYRIKIYGTGSAGNCMTLTDGSTRIMIDAGVNPSKLMAMGLKFSEIDYIFITHEHGDHNRFAGQISTKFEIPVIASQGTLDNTPGILPRHRMQLVNKSYELGTLHAFPFMVNHDAVEPTGLYISNEYSEKLLFIPETGTMEGIDAKADFFVMEANYSKATLEKGFDDGNINSKLYDRIFSPDGHLAVEDAIEYATTDHRKGKPFLFINTSSSNYIKTILPDNCTIAMAGNEYKFGHETPY
jgi:phosphoribosyl 1,2-cyclic phosphodiesterase